MSGSDQETINNLRALLENKERELTQKDQQISTLSETIKGLNQQVGQFDTEKHRIEEDVKKRYQDEIKLKDQKITSLTEQLQQADGSDVALEKLIENAGDQIERAHSIMGKGKSKFRLGKVNMQVKGIPGTKGMGLSFPQKDDLKGMGSVNLSTINLDFGSVPKEPPKAPDTFEIPSVIGYSQLMAQRKLTEALGRFQTEVSFETVTVIPNRPSMVGRVVNQTPLPGEKAEPNSIVTIYVGKEKQ